MPGRRKIARHDVARRLDDYLHHRLTLDEFVDWVESVVMEAEFEQADARMLRDVVGRIGLADVKAFGMSWEDCEDFLGRLGYQVNVNVSEARPPA
ncbi:MAG: hypothetical protein HY897_14215 [Deltaproteobacteria bacterium]|nr:hypothetical protein [Deltaproteobacteria bacterium]